MFDHKHVYVSLLKHKCLKVKHVSVSCFYSDEVGPIYRPTSKVLCLKSVFFSNNTVL